MKSQKGIYALMLLSLLFWRLMMSAECHIWTMDITVEKSFVYHNGISDSTISSLLRLGYVKGSKYKACVIPNLF